MRTKVTKPNFDVEKIKEFFAKCKIAAKDFIEDETKLEGLLQDTEERLKTIPKFGKKLAYLPMMISLVRSYVIKEYTDVPRGTILSIVATIIYFVSPLDALLDHIPVIGLADDAAVLAFVYKQVKGDLDKYDKWRVANGKKRINIIDQSQEEL